MNHWIRRRERCLCFIKHIVREIELMNGKIRSLKIRRDDRSPLAQPLELKVSLSMYMVDCGNPSRMCVDSQQGRGVRQADQRIPLQCHSA